MSLGSDCVIWVPTGLELWSSDWFLRAGTGRLRVSMSSGSQGVLIVFF